MTEKEKSDLGQWYDANYDEVVRQERVVAMQKCYALNMCNPTDTTKRQLLLREL